MMWFDVALTHFDVLRHNIALCECDDAQWYAIIVH